MEIVKFKPLFVERAPSYIEKTIKETILSGTLRPGDKLPTEKEMASQFEVSLVTLREALRALETSGLVKKRKGPGRGLFVSEIDREVVKTNLGQFLSFQDLSSKHLYQVRKIIEPAAIRLTAEQIDGDQLEKLEENVSYCERKVASVGSVIEESDFFDLDRKNNEFHRLIVEGANNPILNLTLDYVFDFLAECETTVLVPDVRYSVQNVRDHRVILEHLKNRDGKRCEKQMILHLKRLDEHLEKIRLST